MTTPFVPYAERSLPQRIQEIRLLIMEMEDILAPAGADPIEPDPADLAGLERWRAAGGQVVITARADYQAARDFCAAHDLAFQAHRGDKDHVVRTAIVENGARADNACYLGVTKDDLPAMITAGVSAAAATDDPWVSGGAHIAIEAAGCAGAVAELVDRLMADGALSQG